MTGKYCVSETLDGARRRLNIGYTELARRVTAVLGRVVTPTTVRRWCLPPSVADSRRPRTTEDYRAAFIVSGGTVTPNSFHDVERWRAELSSAANDDAESAAA